MKCIICTSQLTGRQKKFCSTACKTKQHSSYPAQCERGYNRKRDIVNQKGGKCELCGYNKNLAALVFHHKFDKDISLDMRTLSNNSLDTILCELKKCQLLCSNCHMEVHHPHLKV